MSGPLLAVAVALLLWSGPRTVTRLRGSGVSSFPGLRRIDPGAPLPSGVAAGLLGLLVATPLVAVLAGSVAAVVARGRRRHRRALRNEALLGQLADALAAVGADLRAGRSVAVAVAAAVRAGPDEECGGLLRRALSPSAPGDALGPLPSGPLEAAIRRVSAGAVLSSRTGCSLVAVVGAVEDDLRTRSRVRRELRVAVAGPLAGARVLAGLPVLGLAMGEGVGAGSWHVLTTSTTGQLLLVAGVVLELVGLAWSRAITERAVR